MCTSNTKNSFCCTRSTCSVCKSYPKIPKYGHQPPKIAFVYRHPSRMTGHAGRGNRREPSGNRVPIVSTCLFTVSTCLFTVSIVFGNRLGTFGNLLLLASYPHFSTTNYVANSRRELIVNFHPAGVKKVKF